MAFKWEIRSVFSVSSQESEAFKYLELYIDLKDLQQVKLTDSEAQQLWGLAGQVNCSSTKTDPNMSYQTYEVNTSVKDAKIIDLKNPNKALHKLKSSDVTQRVGKSSIVCFCDSFVRLKNGESQGAFVIFLYRNNKYAPIAWTSRKLKWVVKSTLSAETLALEESLETCFMIKSPLFELICKASHQNIIPICYYTDNKSLTDTINSTKTFIKKR